MYLVDTSVWILHFQGSPGFDIRSFLEPAQIHIALPVYQEVLQGIKNDRVFQEIRRILSQAVIVENSLSKEIFEEAVHLYRLAKRSGLTVRSSVDCLIAACAIRNDLTVLHRNRDYEALSRISPLQHRAV